MSGKSVSGKVDKHRFGPGINTSYQTTAGPILQKSKNPVPFKVMHILAGVDLSAVQYQPPKSSAQADRLRSKWTVMSQPGRRIKSRPECFRFVKSEDHSMPTSFNSPSLFHGRSLVLGLCLGTVLAIAQAAAMGGGNGSSSPSASPSPGNSAEQYRQPPADLTTCPRGRVWNTKRKTCMRMHRGALSDDGMADYAYALAKADRYAEALGVLDLLSDPNTPTALNYRGYATRKLGRTDEGIGYYLRSVALDPHYAQVREYLGEAYVIKGRVDLAKEQLAVVKTLCGTDCEAYRDLSEAIEKAPKI
jgi:hypothetical protein